MSTAKKLIIYTKDEAKQIIIEHVKKREPLPIVIDLASSQHKIFREAFIEVEDCLYEGVSTEDVGAVEAFIVSQGLNAA